MLIYHVPLPSGNDSDHINVLVTNFQLLFAHVSILVIWMNVFCSILLLMKHFKICFDNSMKMSNDTNLLKMKLSARLLKMCLFHLYFMLTLMLLMLLSSNAQKSKNLWKSSKASHVGIHWKALTEYFQISTHLPWFQSFLSFLPSFYVD